MKRTFLALNVATLVSAISFSTTAMDLFDANTEQSRTRNIQRLMGGFDVTQPVASVLDDSLRLLSSEDNPSLDSLRNVSRELHKILNEKRNKFFKSERDIALIEFCRTQMNILASYMKSLNESPETHLLLQNTNIEDYNDRCSSIANTIAPRI